MVISDIRPLHFFQNKCQCGASADFYCTPYWVALFATERVMEYDTNGVGGWYVIAFSSGFRALAVLILNVIYFLIIWMPAWILVVANLWGNWNFVQPTIISPPGKWFIALETEGWMKGWNHKRRNVSETHEYVALDSLILYKRYSKFNHPSTFYDCCQAL